MAREYKADLPKPEFPERIEGETTKDWLDRWDKGNAVYLESLKALYKAEFPKDALTGEIIRFPRGDGFAQYMVIRSRPLELAYLEIGDAWAVEEALIRGLRLKDVKEMVDRDQRIAEMFARRAAGSTP